MERTELHLKGPVVAERGRCDLERMMMTMIAVRRLGCCSAGVTLVVEQILDYLNLGYKNDNPSSKVQ